jgi:ABC-2 type transport system permease protein
MTATATTSTDSTALHGRPGVPLQRLIRVETRKMVDTRSGMWLFIAIGLLTAAAGVLYLFFAPAAELTYRGFAAVMLTPQGFLLPVLGILLITSEWGQRTGLVTFTLEPSRGRVIVAKTAAAVLVGLFAIVVLLAVAAVGNWLGTVLQDGAGGWEVGGRELTFITVLQLSAILQGLAFGMVLKNSAAAIVAYFVLPIAFSIVFQLVEALRDIAPWIDLATAQEPLFRFGESLSGEQWAHVGVTALIWIALPFAVGVVRLLRSEIKSA